MSYILDALKKSEEERRKLQEQQNSPYTSILVRDSPQQRKKSIVPGIMISSFLLIAILIMSIGWWFLDRTEIENKSLIAEPAVKKISPDTHPEQRIERQEPQTEPDKQNNKTIGISVQTASDEVIAEPKKNTSGSPPKNYPLLSELPFSTRSMLPEMKFRGHVYSSIPSKRMIMINSTVVREGDLVAQELTLKVINETGLIMKYRETLFQVKLF